MKMFFLRIKWTVLLSVVLAVVMAVSPTPLRAAQRDPYQEIARKLRTQGLSDLFTYEVLEKIVHTGPRLAGSPQAAAAVNVTRRIMEELGFDDVHLESTMVPHWVRGPKEEAELQSSLFGGVPLSIAAIGGSIATPEKGLEAQVIEVKSFSELKALGGRVKGKIVFFNRPMNPGVLNTFSAYGQAASQRTQGAVEAARAGAVGALVRSLTMRRDDYPHTGMMRYDPEVPKIPAACVSTMGADLLSQVLKIDPDLKVAMTFHCRDLPPVESFNVMGQITGKEKPDEIIVLGGHLDCWDLSHGAHDDGAGCAQAIAALALIQKLSLEPKRTIRVVMFMNEEFGGSGGRDYTAHENRRGETPIAAFESDRGGFLPLGIGIGGNEVTLSRFKRWEPLFQSVGLQWLRQGGGGVDIAPLGRQGAVLCGLIPDSQRYFDVHHSAKDTIETVNPRELELGTIAMALWAYLVAQEGI